MHWENASADAASDGSDLPDETALADDEVVGDGPEPATPGLGGPLEQAVAAKMMPSRTAGMRRRRRRSRLPEGPELVRLTLWSIFLSSSNSFPRQRTCTIE